MSKRAHCFTQRCQILLSDRVWVWISLFHQWDETICYFLLHYRHLRFQKYDWFYIKWWKNHHQNYLAWWRFSHLVACCCSTITVTRNTENYWVVILDSLFYNQFITECTQEFYKVRTTVFSILKRKKPRLEAIK